MPAGAPTKYQDAFDSLAYRFRLLGLSMEEMAEEFEVNRSTINDWRKKYPSFDSAIKRGGVAADAEIAEALNIKARGYELEGRKIPGETAAMIFILKNRQSKYWKDRRDYGIGDDDGETLADAIKSLSDKLPG